VSDGEQIIRDHIETSYAIINNMPKLYVIATPIGNLEDITLRAIRILKEVDMILCEDTRTTHTLLKKYDITTRTMSYHTHSKEEKHEKILELLETGKDLALVSDAGTPAISDPGMLLVSQVYEKLNDSVSIIPIPGASALISLVSISGFSAMPFTFLGFVPHKKGRETFFNTIAQTEHITAFYESPHRIIKTLESLAKVLPPERTIFVGRELTKLFEQTIRGSAQEVLEYFTNTPDKIRGEFAIAVKGD
jgi:16S rRNA (cytidine1402-2'-O)-methyltransferase